MKPGHKINITFGTTSGQNNCIPVNYGTTIDEALKYYLRKTNKVEYIGTKNIRFSFKSQNLKFLYRSTCYFIINCLSFNK